MTTIAGVAGTSGSTDATGTAARFYSPQDVCIDSSGNVYVANTDGCTVRKMTPAGAVTTIGGTPLRKGSNDGVGMLARFNFPIGVAVDAQSNVFVADTYNNTIRKIAPDTTVTTYAGAPSNGGYADGVASTAVFNTPTGIAVDKYSNLYVADTGNNTIRLINHVTGMVSAYAGSGPPGTSGDVDNTFPRDARFTSPNGLVIGTDATYQTDALYVADAGNDAIREIVTTAYSTDVPLTNTPIAGSVTTLAGVLQQPGSGDGAGGGAQFYGPNGITWNPNNNLLYVADTGNNTIRTVSTTEYYGTVMTIAGSSASAGSTDAPTGPGTDARFNYPDGIAVTPTAIYVADTNNHTIRQLSQSNGTQNVINLPNGKWDVNRYAGVAGVPGAPSQLSASALTSNFKFPMGVAADAQGDLFIADTNNNIVRKIDSTGIVTTFAGIANSAGTTDGAESNAQFSLPSAIACDSTGTNVFVADSDNQTIRQIIVNADGAGTVTTIAGLANTVGSTDGSESGALFNFPQGLALAGNGTLYVSDSGNDTIRQLTPNGTGYYAVTTLAGTVGVRGHADATGTAAQFNSPFGLATDNAGNVFVADAFNYVIRKIDPSGVVTTIAGQAGSAGDTDGAGTSEARFTTPQFLGVDPATGNIFVADTRNNTIRLLTPDTNPVSGNPTGTYTVSTIAGAPPEGSTGYEDGPSPIARFDEPYGIAADTAGNLYVGDSLNATVRRISKGADGAYGTGTVTTIAGVVQYSGNTNGKGSGAQFWYPYGVAVQGTGNNARIYVADSFNSVVRKIDMSQGGLVTTIAGIAGVRGAQDGAESTAVFLMPTSVAVDSSGIVYVADSSNSTIRKIVPASNGTTDGTVYTVAGAAGSFSYADGVGTAARFNTPTGIAVDSGDNLYVADKGNNVIRKITPFGVVTTLAGSQQNSGAQDGVGTNAWFNAPAAVSVDADGNVYVTDSGNQTIRKITPDRIVTTLGGSAGQTGSLDGTGSAALFNFPTGVTVDSNGVLYVADTMNNTIRQGVSTSGSSGSGGGGSGGAGSGGGGSGGGGSGAGGGGSGTFVYNPATPGTPNSQAAGVFQAVNLFVYPAGVARDSSGNLYVADPADNIIQKIDSSGMVATLAGIAGAAGAIDATGSNARFNQPNGLAVDASGNVYVADTGNGTIRKITPAGVVTTLAGSIYNRGNHDGTGLNAWFSSPTGVTTDGTGNVYVADAFTNTIRMVTSTGTVSTIAGSASVRGGSADGTGTAAQFNYPTGIAVDGSGNLFVADTYNDTVRKIAPGRVVTTIAGVAGLAGSNDNAPSVPALFNQPMGITVDSNGNVFVADTINCTIRELTPSGNVTTIAGNAGTAGIADGTYSTSLFNQPRGLVPDGAGNLYVADTGNAAIRKIAIGSTTVTVSTPAMTQGTISQSGSVGPIDNTPIINNNGVNVSTGGGGAVEPPFLALLALLGILRWLTRKK